MSRELTPEQRASLDRLELSGERLRVLREARVVGMVTAIEHLVRHSPLPIDLAFVNRHLGLDGRGPEADAVSEAIGRLLSRSDRMQLAGNHTLRACPTLRCPDHGELAGACTGCAIERREA